MIIQTKDLLIYKRIFILGFFFRNCNFKESIDYLEFTVEKLISYSNRYIYIYIVIILSIFYLYLHEICWFHFHLKLLNCSSIYFRSESHFFFRLCFIRIPGESRAYLVPTIGKRTCSRRYANRYCPRRYVASNCLS